MEEPQVVNSIWAALHYFGLINMLGWIECAILAVIAFGGYRQLGHIQEQNELQRNVASKSSIQALNEVLLNKQQEDFLRFVFPKAKDKEKAREAMMAFSLMNSLEMLYLTRDDLNKKRKEREKFKDLLRGFIKNVRVHWEGEGQFPAVYHPDFQDIVNEVFREMEKK